MIRKKVNRVHLATVIAINKRVYHEYFIQEEFEAGLMLQGWEVKSLRLGKVNIENSYVALNNGEAFLFGANFVISKMIFRHNVYDSTRIRKLLLNQNELNFLYGRINHEGYTSVVLSLYWKNVWCKIKIGVAKGKKRHDKRLALKEREWKFDKIRILKTKNRLN